MRNLAKIKQSRKDRRGRRTRAKIFGTAIRPRLSVYRSLNYLYAQLIDDEKGQTLLGVHEKKLAFKGSKVGRAQKLGEHLGQEALRRGITQVVFDRGPFKYQGRVKALAAGARTAGLKF